ncbi:sucrose phosphorylase [Thermoflexales bacterium]|nr:sucrose phosphorylase [Thermoflexales bacterium]
MTGGIRSSGVPSAITHSRGFHLEAPDAVFLFLITAVFSAQFAGRLGQRLSALWKTMKNQVQLITYPDSLGGNLEALNELLLKYFANVFQGGVHILPPFPSSADRGFAPTNYFEIDPAFGTWEDIRCLGEHFDILLDLMVNHISRQSPYFQDFIQKGRRSAYADLFITLDKVWPDGSPPQADVARIFLRKPEHPFSDIVVQETKQLERVWTSFGTRDWSEQIDLDVNSATTRRFFLDVLEHMSRHGVTIVRLDAVGYVVKKPGTSCFFVEPEIYEFMEWMTEAAQVVGIELLPEVHAPHPFQFKLASHGYWVYDFVLPGLILYTLFSRSSHRLREYLKVCPRRQFTMLDCHDGIPVQPDLDDILEIDQSQDMVQTCLQRGANLNLILSEDHKRRADFDAHQINCTYYDALARHDDAYLTARAIQFFAPGVPQVYYVGLLAGENDQAEVERTAEGRAINRHNYTVGEIEQAVQKPVVQRLLKLIQFRNQYGAFAGDFTVLESDDRHVRLAWRKADQQCVLNVDLESGQSVIEYQADGMLKTYRP